MIASYAKKRLLAQKSRGLIRKKMIFAQERAYAKTNTTDAREQ
jgi:hypothetical protein